MALLVATYDHQDPSLRELTAPAADAEALATVLRDPEIAGFDVTVLVNEPHHVVGAAIGDLYRDRRRDDVTLLYFTGHGLKDDAGRLYLAMTNTRRDSLLFTALPAEQIDYAMEGCSSRQKILVLDCCYSGAFPSGPAVKSDTTVHALAAFQGRGRTVLTASDSTQYSFEGNRIEGSATHSVFTRFLVEGLRDGSADQDGDGDITVDELYTYVHDRVVTEQPRQRPKIQNDAEGRIVIARNVGWMLPGHLRNSLVSPIANDRLTALEGFHHLHRIGNALVRARVIDEIQRLTDDDSRAVSAEAARLLALMRPADPPPAGAAPAVLPRPDAVPPPEQSPSPATVAPSPEQSAVRPDEPTTPAPSWATAVRPVAAMPPPPRPVPSPATNVPDARTAPVVPVNSNVDPESPAPTISTSSPATVSGGMKRILVYLAIAALAISAVLFVVSQVAPVTTTPPSTTEHAPMFGGGIQGVAFTPDGRRAYLRNAGSNAITVIETGSKSVTATIPVPNHSPWAVAVAPDGRHAYVTTIEGDISVVDTGTNTITDTIKVGGSLTGIAITPDGSRAYVVSGNQVVVFDIASNAATATIPLGNDFTEAVAISPDGGRAYATIGTGVAVIDIGNSTVIGTIRTSAREDTGARGVAVTPDGRQVLVTSNMGSTTETGTVSLIDTGNGTVMNTISVGPLPWGVAITPNGQRAYVSHSVFNNLSVIDIHSQMVATTIPVDDGPTSVAITPDGRTAILELNVNKFVLLDLGST